ncbi:MFS transporter [Roseomonas eburnea]|uniref:MFS transporter n=1 Tax=Neoroseomonas eburnea TaxID=1346889 RepID=A0A9X9XEY1_9PROT|nr:MFS transporter [Neoroseomonas eburnea]MBR0682267.1 MFS transporter [Neoroseomonas eburnea]
MTSPHAGASRIPVLAAASFATATQSFVFAGLLAEMAADLTVPVAQAGQLATAFALAFGLSAPFVAALLGRRERRATMVGALLVLAALNLLIVIVSSFPALLGLRAAAGIAAAGVIPAASAAAFALAPPERRGRAVAMVIGGTTTAFLLGIPLGSVVGQVFGWRGCFAFAGCTAVAAAIAIRLLVPRVPGDAGGAHGRAAALRIPGVAGMLALNFTTFTAVFAISAYIGPVTNRISGLAGGGVGVMQALIGVASLAGLPVGAALADRGARAAVLLPIGVLAANLLQAGLLTGVADGTGMGLPLQAAAVLLSAGCLFALATVVAARLGMLAPEARALVMACNGSSIFLGQAGGAALGGLGIALLGLPGAGLVGALAAIPALLLTRDLTR